MQSETGFPSSHQLKSYVASKSRLKLAARAVLSADAGLLVFNKDDTAVATTVLLNISVVAQRIFTRSFVQLSQVVAQNIVFDDSADEASIR